MPRRWKVFVRLIGAVALAIVGYNAGAALQADVRITANLPSFLVSRFLFSTSLALFGFGFGYLLTPALLRPLDEAHGELLDVPPAQLVGATIGLAIGLFLATLMAYPLSLLPAPFGRVLPFMMAMFLGYLGLVVIGSNPSAYLGLSRLIGGPRSIKQGGSDCILLDTSVIIDGRVADVAETGFLTQRLLVPRFVLNELQQVADSSDALRRNRGRRGLEVLNRMQQSTAARVEISDADVVGTEDVDHKLVRLAEQLHCPIMTNDFNLKRVAEIQGLRVLNLNELANAVKTMLLPGEQMEIAIIQEGKEPDQGVGYLEDGTMVVVEHGRTHLTERVPVTVTRVLQTAAGRMIFAALGDNRG